MSAFERVIAGVAGRVVGAAVGYGLRAVLPGGLPAWDELFNDPADRLWGEKREPKKPPPKSQVMGNYSRHDCGCGGREAALYLELGNAVAAGDFGRAFALVEKINKDAFDQLVKFAEDLDVIFGIDNVFSALPCFLSSLVNGAVGVNGVRGPVVGDGPESVSSPADSGQPASDGDCSPAEGDPKASCFDLRAAAAAIEMWITGERAPEWNHDSWLLIAGRLRAYAEQLQHVQT